MVANTGPKRMRGRQVTAVKQTAEKRRKRSSACEHLLAQREAELAIINSVQEGLASQLEMSAIYELVGQKIREVFCVEVVDIVNYDPDNNLISMPYSYEKGDRSVFSPREPYGFRRHVIQTHEPLLINHHLIELAAQYDNPLLTGAWPKSVLFVPLMVDSKVKSVLSIQDLDREDAFDQSDVQLLQTLARAMSVALENARLFAETQRIFKAEQNARQQAEILRSVAQALNSSLSLTEVLDLVLMELQKVIPYDSAGIYEVQGSHRVFLTGRGFTNLNELIGVGFEFNRTEDEIGYLISQSLRPLILADALEAYPQYFNSGVHAPAQIRGYMAVPIVLNHKMIGMLTLDKKEPGFYQDQHVGLAMSFADQAATAISNARLFDETQQRNAELAIINRVQATLARQLDIHGIYEAVGEKLREIFCYQDVIIYTGDLKSRSVTVEYAYETGKKSVRRSPPMNSLYEYLLTSNRTCIFNGDATAFAEKFNDHQNPEPPRSLLAVPVRRNQDTEPVVFLTILDWDGKKVFSDPDVRLVETLANSMSVAIENARLWEQEELYRKALQRELEIGREIQAGFLPKALPQVEGWEIAAALMSAREVAGDFYDAFELPDGTIGLVIADVCDKGVGAALFMTLFRSLIRAASNLDYFEHTERENPPHPTAERLRRAISLTNNYIAETHGESGMFATMFFGILDPRNGKLIYINGGHELPLILRYGGLCENLGKTGPAVGALPNYHFMILETQLTQGDIFFAFTDGVPDCMNPSGKFFGREQLLNILRQNVGDARQLVKTIQAELRQYISGATQFDDITLLAVRRA